MASKFKPNRNGYLAVLNGGRMLSVCYGACSELAGRLGDGYVADAMHGQRRVHARVSTASRDAYYGERKTHKLRNATPRLGSTHD